MKIVKMIALSTVVALAASALAGCFVETGRWHTARHHEVVFVRR